jgi:hypothetical protein
LEIKRKYISATESVTFLLMDKGEGCASFSGSFTFREKKTHWKEHRIGPTTRLDMVTNRKIHTSCHELNTCDHPIAGHELTGILETPK